MTEHSDYCLGKPLEIGPGPHLFLDDALLEDEWGVRRKVNQPYRYTGNPVMWADRIWEQRPYRPQVFHDEDLGKYRMYYQCFHGSNYWTRKGPSYYTCYAESDDCLNWTKPEWAHSPFGDVKATNLIQIDPDTAPDERTASQIQAPWVFRDPNETNPDRAYKMTYNSGGLYLAYSPDGIRWTKAQEEPLIAWHSDTQNHVLWNDQLGKWMLVMRPPIYATGRHERGAEGGRHHRRRTAVSFSDDLLNWSVPRTVLNADELDPPDFDATQVVKYAGGYLGFVTLLYHEEGGSNDVMLAWSRDGINWTKPTPRQIWLPRGREGEFDAGCAGFGSDPVRVGEELWLYYGGYAQPQAVFEQDTGIGLVKMTVDRFLALEAPEDEYAFVLTKEFVWRGKRLGVNARTRNGGPDSFGELHVEIVQRPDDTDPAKREGAKLEGYTFDECRQIRGNTPTHIVKWEKGDDLSFLEGKPVYLRFRMRNAELFAFTMLGE